MISRIFRIFLPLPYKREIRRALTILDEGIEKLGSESTNWRQVLDETTKSLTRESTEWRDETSYIVDTGIPKIINEGVASLGEEFRCDFDFVRIRARQELISLRNSLAEKIKVSPMPNPRKPVICKFNPSYIDVSLVPEKLKVVEVAGYNFDQGYVTISVKNKDDGRLFRQPNVLAITTHYHMTIRLTSFNQRISDYSPIIGYKSDKLIVEVSSGIEHDTYTLNIVGHNEPGVTRVHRAPPVDK